jgi:hypothetical protein
VLPLQIEIIQHALDLENPPTALLHQVEALARNVDYSGVPMG